MSDKGPDKVVVVKGMELRLRMFIEGMKRHGPKDVPILFGSVVYPTVAALLVVAEGLLAFYTNARELGDAAKKARVNRNAQKQRAKEFMKDAQDFASLLLGRQNPELASFGFKPEGKRESLSAEEEALRVARSRATREARGTKGPRQKEGLKGEVDQVVIDAEKKNGAGHGRENGTAAPPPATPAPRPL